VRNALYQALREPARKNRKVMAAEVIALLEQNIPAAEELRRRRECVRKLKQLSSPEPLYVGLAVQSETQFITADERLANALAAPLPVKWLGAF